MPKFHFLLTAATLVSFAGFGHAQVGSLSDGSLSMGQKVEAPAPTPTTTASDQFTSEILGDWDLQCAEGAPEPRPCRLTQLMKDQNGNPISEISLFKLPQAEGEAVAGATIVVPLETLLPAQLTIATDGTNARRYPFAFCNQVGCVARVGLSQSDIDEFKSGTTATLTIVSAVAPDQVVSISMSLSGFTAAYDKAGPVPQ